jgi:hypothetical protein
MIQPEKPKKRFWKIFEKIAVFLLPMIIKNQKGIKGTPNEKKVDDAFKNL